MEEVMQSCQICQCELDSNQVCPNCGPKAGQSSATDQFQIKAAKPRRIPTEVIFVGSADITGSTGPYSATVPEVFEKVGRGLADKIATITYDVWSHGDLDCGQTPVQLCQHVTLDEAVAALKTLVYDGGGDPAESHADQVENLLNVSQWGADPLKSRNVLLMFATDDTKPTRSGKSMKQLGKEFKDKRVFLFLVCQETANLRELVDSAGGVLVQISTNPDATEIQKVVAQLTASIATTVVHGATIPLSSIQGQAVVGK
jgi:hypothetical protein